MGTIVTNKTDWVGTKAQYLTTFPNGTDRRCYITDLSAYSITGADMILALTTQKAFYVVNDIFVCSESSSDGVYELGHTYQYKGTNWQDITLTNDYSIVDTEPSDKTMGKMIYLKSEITLGKATINKTVSGFYSKPEDVYSKMSSGTATASDLENYEYILSSDNGYILGYINLGDLTALTQYTGTTLTLYYKINNGEEQSEILTKNEDGWFVGNNLTIFTTSNLGVSVPTNYFSATIQNQEAFAVATTDTIEITRLNIGGTYITPGKIAEGFNISNLKISNGTAYVSLIELIGG